MLLWLVGITPCIASRQHVNLPPVNLGQTNFLDGVGGPGLLVEEWLDYYAAPRFTGSGGQKLPGDNDLKSLVWLTHVAYFTKFRILSGLYGVEFLVPVAYLDAATNLGLRGHTAGVGDLIISPFILQWEHRLWGRPYYHRLDLGFIAPSGAYSRNDTVNVGSRVFSFNPYYAFTLKLTTKLETSWRIHYLWNSENSAPSRLFHADNTQPGQAIHFNAALSYEVWPGLRLGFASYFLRQRTASRIDGRPVPNSQEQVAGVGPGLLVGNDKLFIYLNAYFEVGVQNRPQGTRVVLRLSKAF